ASPPAIRRDGLKGRRGGDILSRSARRGRDARVPRDKWHRQFHFETAGGAVAGDNGAAVNAHDALCDGKTETCAVAGAAAVERFEYPPQIAFGDTRAAVGNRNDSRTSVPPQGHID